MATIWKYELLDAPGLTKSIEMPTGAQIVHFAGPGPLNPVPTIWALVHPDADPIPRRFRVYGTGDAIPPGAAHVGTFTDGPFVWHVLDITYAIELPADVAALPQEAQNAYRLLVREGFALTQQRRAAPVGERWAWVAPDDEPLTAEQTMALAELADHGMGTLDR